MRAFRHAAALVLAFAMTGLPAGADGRAQILRFQDLKGWDGDDHMAALSVFRETCPDIDRPDWGPLCALAGDLTDARGFFELFFRPVLIGDGTPALFTGYFEPELEGSRTPTARFRYPIYRYPPEVTPGEPWFTRAEIEEQELLQGRGLEIVWLDDPVEVFFLQVQGSGRVRLRDGSALRVGYGGKNGHPYRSIGQELVRRGVYRPHQVSAQVIRNWVRRNPDEGRTLLWHNPSFVFFREIGDVPAEKGPLGAMNRSVTALRSVAVDPDYVPLGAPVWIEKGGKDPMHKLMVAQDTGSAIKGAQRADIFFGTGAAAGKRAGTVRDSGRLVVLLPISEALRLAPEG
ncbi:membrane-bound lytic murein transglycosylase A [Rhodovulum iodosum]|uniref:peptidoglycan lytic exotransglycosylase n=2 Tax=Rhodovulum iodosum TaxID=68291 RepID=A0ABV3XT58_9RHOB|nr:murein transglycosylase [Rhodovulum robiginosum]